MKPEILTHPNIPKPLHSINPRNIKGQEWWDITRQEVYKKYDYHCSACGVHKTEAKKNQWLEAHEYFDINYYTGIVEIKSIEPLCHYCHNFIHSGRLKMIMNKEKTQEEVKEILEHGFKILSDNNLKCFYSTLNFANSLNMFNTKLFIMPNTCRSQYCNTYGVEEYDIPDTDIKWNDWKLIFEGKEYKSKFKNFEEWKYFYKQ